MGVILGALKIIILLGTLIIIHEFGHFIVAKACKMKVLKFSIGFGPKIFKKQGKETEYSLRALPLGGFVQLEGDDEESSDPRSFMNKPAWQRLLVLLAGVTINILFALLIYLTINMNVNRYITTKIDDINIDSGAFQVGLEKGDEIYKINGERVYNNYDVSRIISNAESDIFEFEIITEEKVREKIKINIPTKKIGYIGVSFTENVVYSVIEGDAGEKAGLQTGDEILSINGNVNKTMDEYLGIIHSSPNEELDVIIKRGEDEQQLKVLPECVNRRNFDIKYVILQDLPFWKNLHYAINETCYYFRCNLIGIGELITGNTENVEIQGIVGISQQISSTERAIEFFYMMSAISLSLGIMNLLPIPGLDGGKVLFTIVEVIRKKPVSREVEGTFTLVGFAALLILMLLVTVSDIIKLL